MNKPSSNPRDAEQRRNGQAQAASQPPSPSSPTLVCTTQRQKSSGPKRSQYLPLFQPCCASPTRRELGCLWVCARTSRYPSGVTIHPKFNQSLLMWKSLMKTDLFLLSYDSCSTSASGGRTRRRLLNRPGCLLAFPSALSLPDSFVTQLQPKQSRGLQQIEQKHFISKNTGSSAASKRG